jgi:hypothetical protein
VAGFALSGVLGAYFSPASRKIDVIVGVMVFKPGA